MSHPISARRLLVTEYGKMLSGKSKATPERIQRLTELFPEVTLSGSSLGKRSIDKVDLSYEEATLALFKSQYPTQDALIDHYLGLDTWQSEGDVEEAKRLIRAAFKEGGNSLELSGLGLTTLPSGIEKLKKLVNLRLNGNAFSEIPPVVMSIVELETLNLMNNKIGEVPGDIGKLAKLRFLDLQDNQISALPDAMGALKELERLDMSGNRLTILPPWIGNLVKMRVLILHDNELKALPQELCSLEGLKIFTCFANQLGELSSEVQEFLEKKKRCLTHAAMCRDVILSDFDSMVKYKTSNIKDVFKLNKMFPEVLAGLSPQDGGNLHRFTKKSAEAFRKRFPSVDALIDHYLELDTWQSAGNVDKAKELIRDAFRNNSSTLHLHGLGLTTLPSGIEKLESLTTLNLSNNKFQEIPPVVFRLPKLTSLGLDNNKITALPGSIQNLRKLTYLNVSANRLSALPDELGGLEELQGLNLGGNAFTEIPPVVFRLSKLTSLNLMNSKIKELPEDIDRLTELVRLNLKDNQLRALPEGVGRLIKLIDLNLEDNQFEALPIVIRELKQLDGLDLENNSLQEIPSWIGELTNLVNLQLSDNQLTGLPQELSYLKKLQSFSCDGNKFGRFPSEVREFLKSLSGSRTKTFQSEEDMALRYLGFEGNYKSCPEFVRRIVDAYVNRAKKLDLRYMGLTSVPEAIKELEDLEELDLSGNNLPLNATVDQALFPKSLKKLIT